MGLDLTRFDCVENLVGRVLAGEHRPFHEPLVHVEGVGAFAGEEHLTRRLAFDAADRGELTGLVAGV